MTSTTTTSPQNVVVSPRVSFSTLAKVMGPLSLPALASRIRGHKYPTDGPKRSYQNATRQAVDHLVSGAALNAAASLRPHEKEAVVALAAMGFNGPRGFTASHRSGQWPAWSMSGVEISIFPDAELASAGGVGAVKFSFTKDALPRGVGSTMAALLWYYLAKVRGVANVIPSACVVYEPRASATYRPGANPPNQVAQAQLACQIIATIWPTL